MLAFALLNSIYMFEISSKSLVEAISYQDSILAFRGHSLFSITAILMVDKFEIFYDPLNLKKDVIPPENSDILEFAERFHKKNIDNLRKVDYDCRFELEKYE
jgi:hypothetical protein